jgi:hypothetical protein
LLHAVAVSIPIPDPGAPRVANPRIRVLGLVAREISRELAEHPSFEFVAGALYWASRAR